MKKKNQKGFMLVETLVVSTFVLGSLVFLFIQFRNVNQGYNRAFHYNTVNGLYASENIGKFLKQDNYETMTQKYRDNRLKYVDLTGCPSTYIKETSYCLKLMDTLDVKKVILTDADLSYIRKAITNNEATDISSGLTKFINSLNNDEAGTLLKYRVIVEMNDGTYASVKMKKGVYTSYELTNLVPNSSFENAGWTSSYGSYSTEQAKYGTFSYKVTGNASALETLVYSSSQPALVSSHIYYARVEAYQTTRAGNNIQIYFPEAEPYFLTQSIDSAGIWNTYSATNTRSSFSSQNATFRIDYDNINSNQPIYFDGVMLIDLTAAFGSGKEPTKEWCDKNIPYFDGSYTISIEE